MSDRLIAVGDLVQVVRPCPHCGDACDLGQVFVVKWLGMDDGNFVADCCLEKGILTLEPELCANDEEESGVGWSVLQLKRIPPLTELESAETDERTPA